MTTKFHLILANTAGKLDERFVNVPDECGPELTNAVADFAYGISFRDGDTIRIVEILDVEMPEDDRCRPDEIFAYTRADEVAECWPGLSEALYIKLWNQIVPLQKKIPNIEDSGPHDHVGHESLAAHWHILALADQIELNALAAQQHEEYERWRASVG